VEKRERERVFILVYIIIFGQREERKWGEGETGGWIFGFKSWLAAYLISAQLSYSRPGSGIN